LINFLDNKLRHPGLEATNFTMGSVLDEKSLDKAFEGRPDLQAAVRNAAAGQFESGLFPIRFCRNFNVFADVEIVLIGSLFVQC